jgi:hypothetical protein
MNKSILAIERECAYQGEVSRELMVLARAGEDRGKIHPNPKR